MHAEDFLEIDGLLWMSALGVYMLEAMAVWDERLCLVVLEGN